MGSEAGIQADSTNLKLRELLKETQLDYSSENTKIINDVVSALKEAIDQIPEDFQVCVLKISLKSLSIYFAFWKSFDFSFCTAFFFFFFGLRNWFNFMGSTCVYFRLELTFFLFSFFYALKNSLQFCCTTLWD